MEPDLKYGYWGELDNNPIKKCIRVSEYNGEAYLSLACTQLDDKKEQTGIVGEWCSLFRSGDLGIKVLWFESRISQKLFDAICCQEGLEGLWVKWGVYPDISQISRLQQLQYLHLGSGAGIKDISAVSNLKELKCFEADNLQSIHDYAVLTALPNLKDLLIEGDALSAMKPVEIKTLGFLREMPQIVRLSLLMTKITDQSYLPVLGIKDLQYLSLPDNKDVRKDRHLFDRFMK